MKLDLPDEDATLAFAGRLYRHLPEAAVVFLHGPLGAGKTAFVRGCLRAAGHDGAVKSPTFTLVEEYRLTDRVIYHFDLYRLEDPEELEFLGIRDYFGPQAQCFIEWPERGEGVLPPPDLDLFIEIATPGRRLNINAVSADGRAILKKLDA